MLTDAGELLVSHADAAICRLEQAERELGELNGLGAGDLRLVSFSSASATVVAAAARKFSGLHPDVRLSLSEGEPEEAIDRLKRGDFDVALAFDFELYPFEEDRDIVFTHLLDERMHVALPPDHPLADRKSVRLEELAGDPWLCGSGETSCRQLTLRSCERAGFTPDVAYESNDYTVMLALVKAGMGVTLVPDLALMIPSPDVPMLEIEPEAPTRRVWALTLQAGSRSSATDEMIELLARSAPGSSLAPAPPSPPSPACSTPSPRARARAGSSRGRGRGRRACRGGRGVRFRSCHIATYSWKAARIGLKVPMFLVRP